MIERGYGTTAVADVDWGTWSVQVSETRVDSRAGLIAKISCIETTGAVEARPDQAAMAVELARLNSGMDYMLEVQPVCRLDKRLDKAFANAFAIARTNHEHTAAGGPPFSVATVTGPPDPIEPLKWTAGRLYLYDVWFCPSYAIVIE